MFFGIPQTYTINIYGFYFEEYMFGYLPHLHHKSGFTLFPSSFSMKKSVAPTGAKERKSIFSHGMRKQIPNPR